jgi:hypothetical protein
MNPNAAVTPDENRRVLKNTIPNKDSQLKKMNLPHQLNN